MKWLRQRWLFSLLGVVALALLVWLLGPLWDPLAPAVVRIALIALLFVLWGSWWGWCWWQARRRSQALAAGMAADDDTGRAVAEEEEILRTRFQEALAALRQAYRGRHLYQLPWYVLIGPPGAGKTTLLANSKLRFPLAERFGREALRGVGGTRNCDWWFAEEAVLLDTAGRYTTQDSRREVDQAAWLAFLALLKRYRPRRPLNGVLVVLDLAVLLTQDEEACQAHARAIRQRIQELYQRLGVRLPVYVIVNKCDLLAGFDEHFGDLTPEARDQVWGMTFPLETAEDADPLRHFEAEFPGLEKRLHGRLFRRLAEEVNLDRRERIFLFPHQFAGVREPVKAFLDVAFRPSRFETPVLLRGIYFTSATQEGTPIDRILASLARTFSLPRGQLSSFSGKGRAFFVNDLLLKLIFPEAGLAGVDWRREKRRRRLQALALAGIGLVALGLVGAWGVSALENRRQVRHVLDETAALAADLGALPGDPGVGVWLPLLDRARALVERTAAFSWRRDFGLSQDDKLTEAARSAYRQMLLRGLLPRVMAALEDGLRESMGEPGRLYRTLKAYLMLDSPAHYRGETILRWLTRDWWERGFPGLGESDRRRLRRHLQALFADGRPAPLPRPLDAALIEEARVALANRPLAALVYDSLKSRFPDDRIEPFVPSRELGSEGLLVFRRLSGKPLTEGISGLFTRAGYRDYVAVASAEVVKTLERERWIYGDRFMVRPARLATLRDEVLGLYARDYIRRWQQLLGDVVPQPPRNLEHALEMLKILAGPDSPLKKWFVAVARETRLSARAKPDATAAAVPLPRPIAEIEAHFEALQRQVTPPEEGGSAPIDALLGQLNEVYVQLDAFSEALESGNGELIAEQARRVKRALKSVELAAARQPAALAQAFGTLAGNLKLMTAGGRRQYLNAMWKADVLPFCRRAIAGRYPVVAGSRRDITLADFARFFGPGGLMASFFERYLSQSVDRSRSPWRWNPHEGAVVSRQALHQFEIAEEIRNVFFGASSQPLLRFSLEPISMSMDAMKGELDIDGQRLVYEHGPVQPRWFRWPGREAGNVVRLRFLPPVAGRPSGTTLTGPWAWLRLVDDAEVVRTVLPEQFLITFRVGGRYLKVRLRASSAFNPFGSEAVHRFRCLPHL